MKKSVSIIIPSWNGKKLLEKNLPFLLKALKNTEISNEVIIVDDGSTDDTENFIKENYPEIKFIKLKTNCGFAHACNVGVLNSTNSIIYLLNNDVQVTDGFLEPVIKHFEKKDTFAVNSREITIDRKNMDLHFLNWIEFKFGIFWNYYKEVKEPLNLPVYIFAVSGGHSAFDKEKFLSLGGFDEMYSPIYWEDVDICYRAWKRGWKSIYESKSEVYHFAQSTIRRKYKEFYRKSIHWKNRFLFTWKNLKDTDLLFQHILFLPGSLIIALFHRPFFTFGFLFALLHLDEVIKNRRREKNKNLVSDKKILELFKRK